MRLATGFALGLAFAALVVGALALLLVLRERRRGAGGDGPAFDTEDRLEARVRRSPFDPREDAGLAGVWHRLLGALGLRKPGRTFEDDLRWLDAHASELDEATPGPERGPTAPGPTAPGPTAPGPTAPGPTESGEPAGTAAPDEASASGAAAQPVDEPPPAPPEDFLIEVRAGAVSPPFVRRQRLTVDAGGAVRFEHRGPPEDPGPVEHSFYLADRPLADLGEAVRDSGVLTGRGSRDPDIVDGDFLAVRVRMDGRENQVTLVNTFDEAATALVQRLNGLLPDTMQVWYSLLEGPEPPLPEGLAWP